MDFSFSLRGKATGGRLHRRLDLSLVEHLHEKPDICHDARDRKIRGWPRIRQQYSISTNRTIERPVNRTFALSCIK